MKYNVWVLAASLAIAATVGNSSQAFAKYYAGGVNADGSKQVNTTKYAVSHPSKGSYTITFGSAFSPYPTCIFMPVQAVRVSGLVESSTKCTVSFVSLASGALTDSIFAFIAISTTN